MAPVAPTPPAGPHGHHPDHGGGGATWAPPLSGPSPQDASADTSSCTAAGQGGAGEVPPRRLAEWRQRFASVWDLAALQQIQHAARQQLTPAELTALTGDWLAATLRVLEAVGVEAAREIAATRHLGGPHGGGALSPHPVR